MQLHERNVRAHWVWQAGKRTFGASWVELPYALQLREPLARHLSFLC